jgi:Ras-related protein Rab-5C
MSKSNKASSVKVVLVGPSNAGKTSIAKRFTTDQFDEFQDMTVGSAFFSKQIQSSRHGTSARVEVWDTAGQEKYRAMAPMYFRNAAGALLVFDQTSPSSFDDVERIWLPELLPHMKNSTQFIVMCGNKCDAIDGTDAGVAQFLTRVEAMCSSRGIKFFSTSAKSGHQIVDVFTYLVDEILDGRAKEAAAAKSDRSASSAAVPVSMTASGSNSNNEKGGCCK